MDLQKNFIDDGPNLDAFSRLRTSSAMSQFDAQLTYDLQPLLYEQLTNGTGASIAHNTTERLARMTFSSTPTGGYAYMQTYTHFRYTAGKGQLAMITFNMNGGVANVLKFAGLSAGATNGIEFQMNGTTPQFVIYSDTTNGDQTVTQTNWNIDKLDGTGPSKITIDFSKTQILVIDFQALYVGRVRVGFDINGIIYYVHQFTHANRIAYPYIQTANLPIRCGMSCTGTVSTTMDFICATVQTEDGDGGAEGFHFMQGGTVTAASGARTHAISIQPKTTFNGITNRTKIEFENIDILVTGNNSVRWELVLGDVITGTTTFNDVNATYSAVQYNTAGTTSAAPAIVIDSGFIPATNNAKGSTTILTPFKYPITLDAAGNVRANGRLTLLLTGLGGTSVCYYSMNWVETR